MNNRRIAIIRTDPGTIDFESYNCQELGLAKGLALLGVDIDIFMGTTNNEVSVNALVNSYPGLINVVSLPFKKYPLLGQAYYPDLTNTLDQKRYDLLHVNEVNEITTYLIARYAKKKNIKFIIYQGMYKQLSGKVNTLKTWLIKTACHAFIKKSVTMIAAKTSRAQKFITEYGFSKTTVFPVGLDDSLLLSDIKYNVKDKFSIPEGHKILCYVGVFEARRNIDFLVDLGAALAADSYSLILVGDGPEFEAIQQKISDNKITNVHLLGRMAQKDLAQIYRDADIFLLASDYEIYGMVVLEALYYGCPVFSTNTAGPEDLINNDINGQIFDSLNLNLWTSKILSSHNLFNRENISQNLKRKYLWVSLAEEYVKKFIQ
jgi:glycosyltransferase involved in cell wall biosynthesis